MFPAKMSLPTFSLECPYPSRKILTMSGMIFKLLYCITKAQYRLCGAKDFLLKKVKNYILSGWPNKKTINPDLRCYWEIRNELSCIDGLLKRGYRTIPPSKLRRSIVLHGHEGQSGIVRAKQMVKSGFWWPGMDIFI